MMLGLLRISGMFLIICTVPVFASASPAQVWQQAMNMAAGHHDREAIAYLNGAISVLPDAPGNIWKERMQVGVALLSMRQQRALSSGLLQSPIAAGWPETSLIRQHLASHPAPANVSSIMPGIFAAFLPGAGHAWQGRWRDAGVAAMLVWPMLALTLWAARRRMGPVTVFFALMTLWLWSGTVFSAVSLSERANLEAYMLWWQELWQASALPGRPW